MIDNYKITQFLTNNELFDYLRIANLVGNHEFILKYKDRLGDLALFVADQNLLKTKAKVKLPAFYEKDCFYTVRSLEQCTDEAVASYKAGLMKGDTILTLAAGLGADDVAFSGVFKQVVSVDNDATLNTLAIHNFNRMGITNIQRVTATAESFLEQHTERFDVIYTDPDRRADGKRQILLSQHQPDVTRLLSQLLKTAPTVYIKCSPLYDMAMALQEINGISEIYCISLKGEVKEMLLKVEGGHKGNPKIICADIGTKGISEIAFTAEDMTPEKASTLEMYFYEAGAATVKVRKHHTMAALSGLKMLDPTAPFYTGDQIVTNFIGKNMRIETQLPLNPKQIKTYLKQRNITMINIKARGVKTDIPSLFKQTGVKEGGEDFLFICPFNGKNTVIHCRPV